MTEDDDSQRREKSADVPDEVIEPSGHSEKRPPIVESVHTSLYAGPIPPPEALDHFERTLPGAADRILKMAESQQAHRQALEVVALNHEARRSMAGLIAGVVVALAALALAGVLAAFSQPVWSAATAFGAIATLAGVFVYGTHMRRKERTVRLQETLRPTVDVSEAQSEAPSSDPALPRE